MAAVVVGAAVVGAAVVGAAVVGATVVVGPTAVVVTTEVVATGAVVSALPLHAEVTSSKATRTAYFLTVSVCHPSPQGGGGDIGAPRCRYAVFALGIAADPCPGEAELARFLPL